MFAVAAARRVAAALDEVEPDALAEGLLERAGLPAQAVLGEAVCTALRDGRCGGAERADVLMRSLARRARGAPTAARRSAALLARIAACALAGTAQHGAPDARPTSSHTDTNWLAALARAGGRRFWRSFTTPAGRGSLLATLSAQQAQGKGAFPGAAHVWALLWDTVLCASAGMLEERNNGKKGKDKDEEEEEEEEEEEKEEEERNEEREEEAVALAVRAAALMGVDAAARAAEAVAARACARVRTLACSEDAAAGTARAVLDAMGVLRGHEGAFVDALLALLCRCVEADGLAVARDVLAALGEAAARGRATAAQQRELTVVGAFLLATTAGALGEDLVPVLAQGVAGVACAYVRALVQCSLIAFLYTAEEGSSTKRRAEELLGTLERQAAPEQGRGCACQSQPGQSSATQQDCAPLGMTLVSFARYFCRLTHSSGTTRSEWLGTMSKKLATLSSCRPMLLFFLSPLLLPQYSHENLDQIIPLFQTLATRHPEECFALFPHVLNLLVSNTLSPKSLLNIFQTKQITAHVFFFNCFVVC